MLPDREAHRDSVPRLVMKAPSAYHIEKFQVPRGKTAVQHKPHFWVQFRHNEPRSGSGNSLRIQVPSRANLAGLPKEKQSQAFSVKLTLFCTGNEVQTSVDWDFCIENLGICKNLY